MAWERVATNDRSDAFQKWTQKGQTVEGVYRGLRDGKYGPNVQVKTKDRGLVSCNSTRLLIDKLNGLNPGDLVKIEYLGKVMGKSGREFMNFDVFMDVAKVDPATTFSPLVQELTDSVEFVRLAKLIEKEKGKVIADAIAAAAKAAGDPVKSLREAMEQIGVVPF